MQKKLGNIILGTYLIQYFILWSICIYAVVLFLQEDHVMGNLSTLVLLRNSILVIGLVVTPLEALVFIPLGRRNLLSKGYFTKTKEIIVAIPFLCSLILFMLLSIVRSRAFRDYVTAWDLERGTDEYMRLMVSASYNQTFGIFAIVLMGCLFEKAFIDEKVEADARKYGRRWDANPAPLKSRLVAGFAIFWMVLVVINLWSRGM